MKKARFKLTFLTSLFCVSLLISSLAVSSEESLLVTVYFFDIDQGDSIFIDTNGLDVLIDGGPRSASAKLMKYLDALNVSRIDIVVATHPHEDHIGGLITVLGSSIAVGSVLYNGEVATTQTYSDFISLAQGKIEIAERGKLYVLDANVNFTILSPAQPLEFSDVNSNSIVLRLQAGTVAFLFAGDATFEAEDSMMNTGLNLTSQVLKVAHHGSKYATSTKFLNKVKPIYAVISAGLNNPYRHPHSETLERLTDKGVIVYGTYNSGTLVMNTDGQRITVYGNPPAIPEFSQNMFLFLVLALTLLVLSLRKLELCLSPFN